MAVLIAMALFFMINIMTFRKPSGIELLHVSLDKLTISELWALKKHFYVRAFIEILVLGALGYFFVNISIVELVIYLVMVYLIGFALDYLFSKRRGLSIHQEGMTYLNKVYTWDQIAGAIVTDQKLNIMVLGRNDLLAISEKPMKVADQINACIQSHIKRGEGE